MNPPESALTSSLSMEYTSSMSSTTPLDHQDPYNLTAHWLASPPVTDIQICDQCFQAVNPSHKCYGDEGRTYNLGDVNKQLDEGSTTSPIDSPQDVWETPEPNALREQIYVNMTEVHPPPTVISGAADESDSDRRTVNQKTINEKFKVSRSTTRGKGLKRSRVQPYRMTHWITSSRLSTADEHQQMSTGFKAKRQSQACSRRTKGSKVTVMSAAEPRFSCPKGRCNRTFGRLREAVRHGETAKTCRDGENKFYCDICGDSFCRNDVVMRHKRACHLEKLASSLT